MTNNDIDILKNYITVFDLEFDVAPKTVKGWENQIILMWTLAHSRKESEKLKFIIKNLTNEENFSFDLFDNLHFNFDSDLLNNIFKLSLNYYRES